MNVGNLVNVRSVLGAKIPVSYELAKGPFRLFGIDVREAYKLTKKLYQFIKDTKTVVELVAQLAELEGVADAAAGAFAAVSQANIWVCLDFRS